MNTVELAEIKEKHFGNGIDNFTDEFHEVIKQAGKDCAASSLETLIHFLDGDIEWQSSVLGALAGECAKKLSKAQLQKIEELLTNEDGVVRIKAARILGWNGGWPNEPLFEALLQEKDGSVITTMLATVLGLAGVPDRQSVKVAMGIKASGEPITRELVDRLIAEHGRNA